VTNNYNAEMKRWLEKLSSTAKSIPLFEAPRASVKGVVEEFVDVE
jgi:hypothetical protein